MADMSRNVSSPLFGTFRIASSPSRYGHSAGALDRTECAFSCMILPPCAFDAIATTVRKSPHITDCAVQLGSVVNQDSQGQLVVIQATDGPTCIDRGPVGEDGTAVSGQAEQSRAL